MTRIKKFISIILISLLIVSILPFKIICALTNYSIYPTINLNDKIYNEILNRIQADGIQVLNKSGKQINIAAAYYYNVAVYGQPHGYDSGDFKTSGLDTEPHCWNGTQAG